MELPFIVRLGLSVLLVMDVVSSQELVYFKNGSSIKMDPNISETIKSIEWRFGSDIAADYEKDGFNLTYYDPFKGRTVLDVTTGIVTINNMDPSLAGKEYSLEVNGLILSLKFQATELPELPKPTVGIQQPCSKADNNCTRVCEVGSGSDPEYGPVSYSWREDSGEWKDGEQSMEFLKNETSGVEKFFCRVKSPVSLQESDAGDNPLYEPPTSQAGPIIGGVLGAVAVAVVVVVAGVGYMHNWHHKLLDWARGTSADTAGKDD